MGDSAEVQILLQWKQEGDAVVAQAQAQLAGLAAQVMTTNLILRSLGAIMSDNTDQTNKSNVATQAATTGLWSQVQALGAALPGWAQIAIAVGAAAFVFEPIAGLILSAAVALTSFAAGGAAAMAVMAGVVAGFAAIGAAVIGLGIMGMGGLGAAANLATATTQLQAAQDAVNNLGGGGGGGALLARQRALFDAQQALADFQAAHPPGSALTPAVYRELEDIQLRVKRAQEDLTAAQGGGGGGGAQAALERLAKAQEAYNLALARSQTPIALFQTALSNMTATWEKMSVPIAAVIIQWAQGALPAVTNLGSALISWFGDRVPPVMAGISKIIQDLSPPFMAFFGFLGSIMDKVGPQLQGMVEAMIRLGLQGAQGLVTNLVRLSDWFQKELPGLSPIVKSIFDFLGTQVQNFADTWASLTDWVKANWPQTVADAKNQVEILGDAFKSFADPKGDFMSSVKGFEDLGKAIKAVSDSVTTIVGVIGQINDAFQPLYQTLSQIGTFLDKLQILTPQNLKNIPSIVEPGSNVNPRNPTAGGGGGLPILPIDMSTTNGLLSGILTHVATLAGQPAVNATAAAQRVS